MTAARAICAAALRSGAAGDEAALVAAIARAGV
jgi:hypothetical protein